MTWDNEKLCEHVKWDVFSINTHLMFLIQCPQNCPFTH